MSAVTAWAGINAAAVNYNPVLQPVDGVIPFTRSYTLAITSPSNLPNGTRVISFAPQVNLKPVGVTDTTALSYLTFSPNTLTFTGKDQVRNVTVTLNLPATATPGGYGYQIYTKGWPTSVPIVDYGAGLNATASPTPVLTKPTVDIKTPTQTLFRYGIAELPTTIPFTFEAAADADAPITRVDAAVNGSPATFTNSATPAALVTGSGSIAVPITGVGFYTITARAFNKNGDATDTLTVEVQVDAPPPTVSIPHPTGEHVFSTNVGPFSVPFTYSAASGLTTGARPIQLRSVTATLDGVTVLNVSGLTSTTYASPANSSLLVAEGSHVVEITTTDEFGQTARASTNFVVKTPKPVISITNPPDNKVFTIPAGATTIDVPFTILTSANAGFTVDAVSAKLNTGYVFTEASGNLGVITVSSNGTLSSLPPGTYTLVATGRSRDVSVQSQVSFTVTASAPKIAGFVYFDANRNGTYDALTSTKGTALQEIGLGDVDVSLLTASGAATGITTTTAGDGSYTLVPPAPGTYQITTTPRTAGLTVNVTQPVSVIVGTTTVQAPDIGYKLDLRAIAGMRANGFTIGFWKNNIEKAEGNKPSGWQVSGDRLNELTGVIAGLGLELFQGISRAEAGALMEDGGPGTRGLLIKQLIASEYNYANGAYFDGTQATLTYLFILAAEFVALDPLATATQLSDAQRWCDQYNNSHNGLIGTP